MSRRLTGCVAALALALAPVPSLAAQGPNCWLPAELRGYEVAVESLYLAVGAKVCERSASPIMRDLRAGLGSFLAANQASLALDQGYLHTHFVRLDQQDVEPHLNDDLKTLSNAMEAETVQKAESVCNVISTRIHTLEHSHWVDFVELAGRDAWARRVGLAPCP